MARASWRGVGRRRGFAAAIVLGVLLLSACAGHLDIQPDPATQHLVVLEALGQVGRPYKYGGTTPEGFDCSGLVQHVYREAGIQLPRTTVEQFQSGERVKLAQLEPGDLLFYRFSRRPVDHVAIYLGDGQAVHAPANGRAVIVAAVDLPHWKKHYVDAVRVLR
jgi:murein DD-endopeptidase